MRYPTFVSAPRAGQTHTLWQGRRDAEDQMRPKLGLRDDRLDFSVAHHPAIVSAEIPGVGERRRGDVHLHLQGHLLAVRPFSGWWSK